MSKTRRRRRYRQRKRDRRLSAAYPRAHAYVKECKKAGDFCSMRALAYLKEQDDMDRLRGVYPGWVAHEEAKQKLALDSVLEKLAIEDVVDPNLI